MFPLPTAEGARMTDLRARLESGLANRYTIKRELGRGGMATVYLAQDLKHDRPVALKLLHAEVASLLGTERFQREIRLAARLQHPHILGVHDSGVVPGENGGPAGYWFTMPYVEGESLRDRLQRERQLPLEDALRLATETADALDYAHRQGIVHRDIKPENILLSESHALVADFGIARAIHGDGRDERLTSTGMTVGTPAYMSPEQAAGEAHVDARADVYALGAVLYEMLTGETPFTGPTPQAVIARMLTETPRPVRSTRTTVPAAVDLAIGKALARSPADRFATTGEFARALGHGMEEFRRSGESAVTGSVRRAPTMPKAAMVIGLTLVIGLGGWFAWRLGTGGGVGQDTGAKTIAVLPFENQGAESDQYFADGMTDEVRGKLASVPGLQVIARGSSNQYQKTTKSPQDVARELGARYLLTATVRWEKQAGDQSRVRVTPELVEVVGGATPQTRWTQPFDAVLSDVFKVQADIAGQVAGALNVALASGEKAKLEARPTENLAAYDAFLQGNEIAKGLAGAAPEDIQRAIVLFSRAVALDSTFALAWAVLSRAHSASYYVGNADVESLNAALAAAQRALALDSKLATAFLAMGDYYGNCLNDWTRAVEQYMLGRRLAPQDSDLIASIANAQQRAGRWEDALVTLHDGQQIDPRSSPIAQRQARGLLWLRRHDESRAAADKFLSFAPASPQALMAKTMVQLATGDLAGARAVVKNAPREVDPTTLVAYFANYWDLYWVLDDEQQQLLLRLRPGPFGDDRGAWAFCMTQTLFLRGDQARAKIMADSIVFFTDIGLKANPRDAQQQMVRALGLAYGGKKVAAIEAGERAVAANPPTTDAYQGVYLTYLLARLYLLVGEPDHAMDQLDRVLRMPFYVTPAWLRIDPEWEPLRTNPRFQALATVGG